MARPEPRPRPRDTATQGASSLLTELHPLTPDRWADLEQLFGPHGAAGGCWCMWWRRTAKEFARCKGEQNRAAFRALVDADDEPGILAYAGGKPVGWCAVAPREHYPRLARSRSLQPIDSRPVWSITCFFVARAYRRRGVTCSLIHGACDFVRACGGQVIEAYPVAPDDDSYPAPFAYTGLLSAFLDAGFTQVARPSARRVIIRRDVRPQGPSPACGARSQLRGSHRGKRTD